MSCNLKKFYNNEDFIEAGLDESGAGPLIGRVYASAVIIDPDIEPHPYINDSKKVTKKRREIVKEWIEENYITSVAYCDEKEVDDINILQARQKAMHKAISNLIIEPDFLVVDGNYFRRYQAENGDFINHVTVEQGDSKYVGVAAASIIAKVYHDQYIKDLVAEHPELNEKYGLLSNMGYGTAKHLEGIQKYGVTEFHRKSFKCCQV